MILKNNSALHRKLSFLGGKNSSDVMSRQRSHDNNQWVSISEVMRKKKAGLRNMPDGV